MANYNSSYTGAQHDTYVTASQIINLVYPVGSIYMSTNSTSPQTLFGGTWAKMENAFLIGASSTYTAGSTGGEAEHTLIESELPNVKGELYVGSGNAGASAGGFGAFRPHSDNGHFTLKYEMQYGLASTATYPSNSRGWRNAEFAFGSNGAHNNMPPYLAVYMWKRTA